MEDTSHVPRVTIWLTNDHDRRIRELAARWSMSFSGAIARLVDMADVGLLQIEAAERELR